MRLVMQRRYLFQSTLPRGSDSFTGTDDGQLIPFQSTLPRGSDCLSLIFRSAVPKFQSTLPRGSDQLVDFIPDIIVISIHAPSRERL